MTTRAILATFALFGAICLYYTLGRSGLLSHLAHRFGSVIHYEPQHKIPTPPPQGALRRTVSPCAFGLTADQCASALGKANIVPKDKEFSSPQTFGYTKDGVSLLVGFDEQNRAEQFVISKVSVSGKIDFDTFELEALLDQFQGDSKWTFDSGSDGHSVVWNRTDGQAYAGYILNRGWMVIMNKAAMDRHIKALSPR